MTVYFVTRHEGTRRWVRYQMNRQKLPFPVDEVVENFDAAPVQPGDIVMGNLPLHEVESLQSIGARFFALDLRLPPAWRGYTLTATHLAAFRATLTEYQVTAVSSLDIPAETTQGPAMLEPVTIMLVSDESAPNYVAFCMHPTPHVILVVTEAMERQSNWLQKVLEKTQTGTRVKVTVKRLEETSYAPVAAFARDLLTGLLAAGHEKLYVNVSGGLKTMAIAISQVAAELSQQSPGRLERHYLDTHAKLLDRFDLEQESSRTAINLEIGLNLRGIDKLEAESSDKLFVDLMNKRQPIADFLLSKIHPLSQLNGLMSEIGDEILEPSKQKNGAQKSGRLRQTSVWNIEPDLQPNCISFTCSLRDDQNNAEFAQFMTGPFGSLLADCKVFRKAPDRLNDNSFKIHLDRQYAQANVAYLNGKWLEGHVGLIFKQAHFDDWAIGVTIRNDDESARNEIDAIASCGNQMLFAEVKTARQNRKPEGNIPGSKAEGDLYKVQAVGERLSNFKFGKKLYISYYALSEADLRHAKLSNIEVFLHEEPSAPAELRQGEYWHRLSELPQRLDDWAKKWRLDPVAGFKPHAIPKQKPRATPYRSAKSPAKPAKKGVPPRA